MKEIEMIKNEIEQRENSIKEMEEKLKEAKKELRQFEKYRGLKFDLYSNYGGGIYYKGLARDCFLDTLRKLALYIVGTKNKKGTNVGYLETGIKSTKDLSYEETKLCNDFLEEIYPIIAKYMDIVLDNTRTPQNDEVRE